MAAARSSCKRSHAALYRGDPDRHIDPLCSAVAAAVLGDGTRGAAVRAEVEKELERWGKLR
jgi:hypothetical protein